MRVLGSRFYQLSKSRRTHWIRQQEQRHGGRHHRSPFFSFLKRIFVFPYTYIQVGFRQFTSRRDNLSRATWR